MVAAVIFSRQDSDLRDDRFALSLVQRDDKNLPQINRIHE